MPNRTISLLLIAIALIALLPVAMLEGVSAQDYEIVTGMDATIVGGSEYAPGSKSTVQVCVQNNTIVDKIDATAVQGNMSQMYGSAMSLTVFLEKGNAPVVIHTEKLLLGTLRSGEVTQPIPFSIEVNEGAKTGLYQLKLVLSYRTLVTVSETEGNTGAGLDWAYHTDEKELTIEIKRQALLFDIGEVNADLNQGAHKDIEIAITNADNKVAYDAEAEISAQDPLSVTQNRSFLGTLRPDESGTGKFGLKVAGDAIPKGYALDIVIKYRDENGNDYITDVIKVPVEVSSNSSIAEFVNTNFTGMIIGFVLMGIIWFAAGMVSKGRSRKKKS